jgi:RNA polymerase sigma-70 factor (ECF subfamily)
MKSVEHDVDARRWMTEIHAEHSRAVLYFLLGLTGGNRPEAEDMVQETMLRAWRHIDTLPTSHTGLRRWLLTVARHAAIDANRRRQVRPHEIALSDLTDPATADDTTMGSAIAAHSIREALQDLTHEQRAILTELYINGRPANQVAAQRGIPVGTVKSRAHHAVKALRKAAIDA